MTPTILHEDNHCLVVDKPAGLPTQGGGHARSSLHDWAAADLKARHHKPGNVFVGLVHRLDQPVSGAIVIAKTSKGAARLSQQFRDGLVEKLYWAIVEGDLQPSSGSWEDWLLKDPTTNRVSISPPGHPQARPAQLSYRVLEHGHGRTLVEVLLGTGRGHQIRAQLASRGHPIVGDLKYGSTRSLPAADGGHRIALHARRLRFKHPTREEVIEAVAPLPSDWPGRAPVA